MACNVRFCWAFPTVLCNLQNYGMPQPFHGIGRSRPHHEKVQKNSSQQVLVFLIPFTGYISNPATFLSPLKIARRRRRRRDGDQMMACDVMRGKGARAF
jgi:hypothetical protein